MVWCHGTGGRSFSIGPLWIGICVHWLCPIEICGVVLQWPGVTVHAAGLSLVVVHCERSTCMLARYHVNVAVVLQESGVTVHAADLHPLVPEAAEFQDHQVHQK